MSDLKTRLAAFAIAPADKDAMWKLPTPFPSLPNTLQGTNTALLLGIALEARDVLHRGDSQLKEFRFTADHVNRVYHGYQVCFALAQSDEFVLGAKDAIDHLPDALRKVATYYSDKETALQTALDSARIEMPRLRQTFERMVQARDYVGLLKQYEHFGALIDLAEEPASPSPDVPSLGARRRDRQTLEAFKAEVDRAAEGDLGRVWLGRTSRERLLEDTITTCHANISRNQPVHAAIMHLATSIEDVIADRDPLPRNVLRLPSRAPGA